MKVTGLWSRCLLAAVTVAVTSSPALAQLPPEPERAEPATASVSSSDDDNNKTWVGVLPLSDSLTGEAKADYGAGMILFEEQDYTGAFIKFQRAFEYSGDIRLLWNMAVCQKSLHHYTQVQRLIERYKREGSAHMSGEHRADVLEVLDTIRTLISNVRILVNEPDARVFIDGELVGVTPLAEAIPVDIGRRQIRVTKLGFEDKQLEYAFTGGSNTLLSITIAPKPHDAAFEIITSSDATIRIDGQIVGTERWKGRLSGGPHSLRVSARNMRSYDRDLEIEAGQPLRTLYVTLDPLESAVPTWVWIGAGVVAAGGLAAGGYFIFKPSPTPFEPLSGTLPPGSVQL
jgi:hypothetical protein